MFYDKSKDGYSMATTSLPHFKVRLNSNIERFKGLFATYTNNMCSDMKYSKMELRKAADIHIRQVEPVNSGDNCLKNYLKDELIIKIVALRFQIYLVPSYVQRLDKPESQLTENCQIF